MRTISAKVSNEIYELIDELSKQKKITKSELIKQAILNSKICEGNREKLELKRKLLYELNRIGNNINQIAKHCNTNKIIDRVAVRQLAEIKNLLQELTNDC